MGKGPGVGVFVFMIITVILLFTSMVLSAMASADAKKTTEECQVGCSKWSMWSAIISGLSFAIILGIMISLVLFRQRAKPGKKGRKSAAIEKATLADSPVED